VQCVAAQITGDSAVDTRHLNYHAIWSGESFVHNVTGIACLCRLKQDYFRFQSGHGAMLNATRNDTKLARFQNHATIAKLDDHLAPPDQEHFIFTFVMMPGEDTGEFYQFDFLAI
jgi:hypothetical protein